MNSCVKIGGAPRRRFGDLCEKPEGFPKHLPPARRVLTRISNSVYIFIIHPVDYKHVEVTVSSLFRSLSGF